MKECQLVNLRTFLSTLVDDLKFVEHKIIPMENEFIIMIKETKSNKVTIFKNDTQITQIVEKDFDKLKFIYSEDQISMFYLLDEDKSD